MIKICSGIGIAVYGLALLVLAGCGKSSTSASAPTPTAPSPAPPGINQGPFPGEHVYVVSATWNPITSVIFPQKASGESNPTLWIPGSDVSVDGAGFIYVLGGNSIDVWSPIANPGTIKIVRSLPVGSSTKIPAVDDVVASSTGEIFVSEGSGVAVFSSTANGNADPVRYILPQPAAGSTGPISTGTIAVDGSDNLYVLDSANGSILVFGPAATGPSTPERTITGLQTKDYFDGMTTDTAGNLYVVCDCYNSGTNSGFGVYEFSKEATGNVAPMRFITTADLSPYFSGGGVAVDSAGTIFLSGDAKNDTQTLYEFSSTATGSVTPISTVTWSAWQDSPPSRIAVY